MIFIYKKIIVFENKEGEYHRLNGPAYICDNWKEYWIDHKLYSESEYYDKL